MSVHAPGSAYDLTEYVDPRDLSLTARLVFSLVLAA